MRTFLATFLGAISTFATMMLVELAAHKIYPMRIEVTESEELIFPVGILLVVALAHAVGLLVGLIISRIIDKETIYPVIIISSFFFIAAIINVTSISHPIWFIILDFALILLIGITFILRVKKQLPKK